MIFWDFHKYFKFKLIDFCTSRHLLEGGDNKLEIQVSVANSKLVYSLLPPSGRNSHYCSLISIPIPEWAKNKPVKIIILVVCDSFYFCVYCRSDLLINKLFKYSIITEIFSKSSLSQRSIFQFSRREINFCSAPCKTNSKINRSRINSKAKKCNLPLTTMTVR